MKLPDQPAGLHDLPTFARDMRNYVRSITVRPSAGMRVSHTANGTTLDPVLERGQLAESVSAPFRIQPVPGAAAVTIFPGDVENIIPTIGGTSIAAATPPQLTVAAGSVYMECTMDAAGNLTAAEIKNAASLPANTSTLRYRQLGTVSVSGVVVTVTAQTVTTSVSHKLCAGLSTWGQA